MKNLLISIWIRNPDDAGESGEMDMPQKKLTVRLRCSLDNGKKQWNPGDCVDLPEQQARELVDMGLAEEAAQAEAARQTIRIPVPEEKTSPAATDPDSGTSEAGGAENG